MASMSADAATAVAPSIGAKSATTPVTNETTTTAVDAIEIASRMIADEEAVRHEAARRYALGQENNNDETSPRPGSTTATTTTTAPPPASTGTSTGRRQNGTATAKPTKDDDAVADIRCLTDQAARQEAARKYAMGLVAATTTTAPSASTDRPTNQKSTDTARPTEDDVAANIRNLTDQAARQEAARKYAMGLVADMKKQKQKPHGPAPARLNKRGRAPKSSYQSMTDGAVPPPKCKRGRPRTNLLAVVLAAPVTVSASKKRGRPIGSADKGPRKKKAPPKDESEATISPKDAGILNKARETLKASMERVEKSKEDEQKAQASIERAKKRLENAKRATKVAQDNVTRTIDKVADDLLLQPTRWNLLYKKLRAFKEKEGHVKLIRRRPQRDCKPDLTPEQFKKWAGHYATLGKWLGQQRTAKRNDTLEPYQLVLLDRLGVDWTPPQGPTPEKWFAKYEQLKAFKHEFSHFNVMELYDTQLYRWVKTQRTQYRNNESGKQPSLSEERIQLLNDIGFDWREPVFHVPWDDRFEELVLYKKEHGHPHVPWCWTGNPTLAKWVNTQRNKYRWKKIGRKSNLTEEQIEKLESIGFAWNTGGTGRYNRNVETLSEEEEEEE